MEWRKYEVVVDMHLPGGFTKLRWHAGGDLYFDVPTDSIPRHLRTIGSKALLRIPVASRPGELPPSGESEGVVVEELPGR